MKTDFYILPPASGGLPFPNPPPPSRPGTEERSLGNPQVEGNGRAGVRGAAVPEDPLAEDSHRRCAGKPLVPGDEGRAVPQRPPEERPEGGDGVPAEQDVSVRDPPGEHAGSDGHVGGEPGEFPPFPSEEGRVHLPPPGVLHRAGGPPLARETMGERVKGRHGGERDPPPETEPFRRRPPPPQAGDRPGARRNRDARDDPVGGAGGGEEPLHGGDGRPRGRPARGGGG